MFGVLKNKYLLINTIVGLIDSLGNGMLPFATILYFYTFRLSGLPYSLLVALISFAGTPPDLLSPYFLKRFSYKQIMIFYQLSRAIGNAIIAVSRIAPADLEHYINTKAEWYIPAEKAVALKLADEIYSKDS
jgi:hypothetical protein